MSPWSCLFDEPTPSSESQRRNAGTRRSTPSAFRRFPMPKHRSTSSNARWKSRSPSPAAETSGSFLRHPNAASRSPLPKQRVAFCNARQALASEVRYRSTVPLSPAPAPTLHSETRRRNAGPFVERRQHQTPRLRRRNAGDPPSSRAPDSAAEAPVSRTRLEQRDLAAEAARPRLPPGTEAPRTRPKPRCRNTEAPSDPNAEAPGSMNPCRRSAKAPFAFPVPKHRVAEEVPLPKHRTLVNPRHRSAEAPSEFPMPKHRVFIDSPMPKHRVLVNILCRSAGRPPNPRRRNDANPPSPQHRSAACPPGSRHRGAVRSPGARRRSAVRPPGTQRRSAVCSPSSRRRNAVRPPSED
jgi:hypothetical protein